MIAQISGTVRAVGAAFVVVDVGGLGLRALCTPSTAAAQHLGEPATLHTSLVVREDSLTLYGFAQPDERDCFELVQAVSGIGPRIAQALVSVLTPDDLRRAVAAGDVKALTRVPGIGTKVAQRMLLELKDKVGVASAPGSAPAQSAGWRDQVAQGLIGLGWSAKDAESACDRVVPLADQDPQPPLGVLMRAALQTLAR